MNFTLFLTFQDVHQGLIGPYVDSPETDNRVEYYHLSGEWDDVDLFYDDLSVIDNKCNALLDYGEADYFDASKCILLKSWIEERLTQEIVPRYKELLEVLYDFCTRAIELGTGVMIDL